MELILIIISGILAILYGLEVHNNLKLEDKIEVLEFENSKLQNREKLINKLKGDGKDKRVG